MQVSIYIYIYMHGKADKALGQNEIQTLPLCTRSEVLPKSSLKSSLEVERANRLKEGKKKKGEGLVL